MKKSKTILGGLAVMTSTLLAACGASSSKTAANQKLNWIEEAELSTIDVSKIMDDVSFNQVNQVMEGLYTLGIKAVGKYKLVVSLEGKIPYFKLLMAFPLFFPQNEQAVKKYGSKYGTASKYMVYNGPFVLAEHGSFDGRKVPPAGGQSQGDQRQALRASEIGRFC
ncbi:hypothetical protein LDI10_06795 [Lactobacillus delbrueckii subsp. indicus]|nr:hypothetical protein LDI10_06795 [Lactobacillus delbrueckii subsp. indicus]KRL78323.1 hypothetical protein FC09_GL000749 [Lactobacillus delbrueckii subsp. indicus DSM 15996]